MLDLRIDGARLLRETGEPKAGAIGMQDGCLVVDCDGREAKRAVRADGYLLAPGIIDIHGDAFERQIMPRPGVHFDMRLALADTDRQLVANGITTAFHGVTYSWEPGLRGRENCVALLDALESMRPRLAADNQFHLRFETFNLDGAADVTEWLDANRVGILAFNDHALEIAEQVDVPKKVADYAHRTGLDVTEFKDLVGRVVARADEVPAMTASLAEHARAHGIAMLSHDDPDPETRASYRALGCLVAEFPETEATARAARQAGDDVVMGAPNVVRGGSQRAAVGAADLVVQGLCDVLASDYYYPAQLQAAFRLVREGSLTLPDAWALIARNAAHAAGLTDRGVLQDGKRADVVLIDDQDVTLPRVAASYVAGATAFFGDDALLAA